jgi:Tol biopolymer transport system component
MTSADPELKERLSRAVDLAPMEVERHLDDLHSANVRRSASRRIGTIAFALGLAVLALMAVWRLLPLGTGEKTIAGVPTPSGRIAYMVATVDLEGSGDEFDLYSVDVATEMVSPLLEGPGVAVVPTWSPDGTRVAFAMDDPGGSAYDLYIMNADSTDLLHIGGGTVRSMTWSPDGTSIAYVDSLTTSDDPTSAGVYVVAADGSGAHQILPGSWESVSWSPDGGKLLLAGYPANEEHACPPECGDLYTVAPSGTDLVRLTADEDSEHYASWSPDGTKIVFGRSDYPDDAFYESDVSVMNADGTGEISLTERPGFDSFPTWSPDGDWIAFASDRGATQAQQEDNATGDTFSGVSVWLMSSNGTGLRMLVDGGQAALLPTSWTN